MTRARDIADVGYKDELVDDTTPQLGGNLDGQTNTLGNVSLIGVGSSTTSGRFGSGLTVRNSVPEVHLKRDDGNGEGGVLLDNASSTQRMFVGTYNANQETHIGTNGTQRIVVDASGRVTLPQQPFFYARSTGSGDGNTTSPFKFQNVIHNVGNHFKTSGTGAHERFVAPIAGVYLFTANPGYKQTGINLQARIGVNGSNFTDMFRLVGGNTSHSGGSAAALIKLNANDYVDMNPDGQTYHLNVNFSYFSGILLG